MKNTSGINPKIIAQEYQMGLRDGKKVNIPQKFIDVVALFNRGFWIDGDDVAHEIKKINKDYINKIAAEFDAGKPGKWGGRYPENPNDYLSDNMEPEDYKEARANKLREVMTRKSDLMKPSMNRKK